MNDIGDSHLPVDIPYCSRCHRQVGHQYVRALGGTFHPECFICMDCGEQVAAKFFPFQTDHGKQPLCENDYFRRLGLICEQCHEPLQGTYITAMDKKYHMDHFTCSMCPTVFGPEDAYYEHEGKVLCHFHYSTQFATSCAGCEMAILKQFVEIDRKEFIEHWHPECYMIHKYWNVRVANPSLRDEDMVRHPAPTKNAPLADLQNEMENKVFRIWTVLTAFEESSAVCISEMLLHVSNGAFVEGICLSERFLVHVEALFQGIDDLDKLSHEYHLIEFKYTKEAKMLCKKIINFFSLLSRTQEMRKLGITSELLSLVTGLAHYLKILIRIALTTALRLELAAGKPIAVSPLLARLMEVAGRERNSRNSQRMIKAKPTSDLCLACKTTVEDHCMKNGEYRWHLACFSCRQCQRSLTQTPHMAVFSLVHQCMMCTQCAGVKEGEYHATFEYVTKLNQFAYLLRIALSRLCIFLQITDSQLSAADQSIKASKPMPQEIVTKDAAQPGLANNKTSPVSPLSDDKMTTFPTHISDMSQVTGSHLERKMSRSFKTAKRSTIISQTFSATREVTEGIDEGEEPALSLDDADDTAEGKKSENIEVLPQHAVLQTGAQPPTDVSRPTPVRVDSLSRVPGQKKNLPPLPHESSPQADQGQGKYGRGIRLDDLPKVAARVTDRPESVIHRNKIPKNMGVPINSITGKPRIHMSELSALQYMIIRHVAVVYIEPYVRDQFVLSDLLQLIDTKKTSIWGKLFPFKTTGSKKTPKGKEDGTFGVPLDVLTERTGVESNLAASPSPVRIAAFIDDAVTAMLQMDMSVEGVFRKNGNIRRLKQVSDQLDKNPTQVDLSSESAIQIAALLKKFLRELPDPILTYRMHSLFTYAQKIENPATRKRVLHLACCMLPRVNRDTLEVLFLFFRWVATFSHVTTDVGSRMDIPNLARVLAPNILTSNSKDPLKDDSFTCISAVETLLESFEELCLVPEDLEAFLEDPLLKDGRGDLKSFLKKVEQQRNNQKSGAPSTTTLNDMRMFEHHPPTSIYAQQGYLPYTNKHPSAADTAN